MPRMSDNFASLRRQLNDELDGLQQDLEEDPAPQLQMNIQLMKSARDVIARIRKQLRASRAFGQELRMPRPDEVQETSSKSRLICGEFHGLFADLMARDEGGRPNIRLAFPLPKRAPKWLMKFEGLRQHLNRSFHEGGVLPVPNSDNLIDLKSVDASDPDLIVALERYILWETLGRVRFVGKVNQLT